MTAPLSDRLQQLEEAVAKGTPGPWVRWDDYPVSVLDVHGDAVAECDFSVADAALIVAAVNAVGPLAAAVREFAELEASYPIGSNVPVYRIGRVLARLESALGGDPK